MASLTVGARIMMVDDDESSIELLVDMLGGRGFELLPFTRAREALAAALSSPPDLVLQDIRMPGMDGYEVCRRLRANAATRSVPVVFLSGLSDTIDRQRAFECGGVDFLSRPVKEEELLARVETHLRLRRLMLDVERHNLQLDTMVRERVRQLSEAHERLTVADGVKTDFLRLISHEFRAPLGGLCAHAELVFDKYASDPAVQMARRGFDRSRRRLTQLLEEARLVTGLQSLSSERAHPSASLREVVTRAIAAACDHARAWNVHVLAQEVDDLRVVGNEALLVRALSSLLEIAVRLTNPEESVSIRVRPAAGGILVVLSARGRPIDEQELRCLFSAPSSGQPTAAARRLGIAPGLAVRIAALSGGEVDVSNRADGTGADLGLRFQVADRPEQAAAAA